MGGRRSVQRSVQQGRRRKSEPKGFSERIETITTPRDRPAPAPSFGSGVIAPGTSRYQRMSAHLPSGVEPFQGLGVRPADVSIDVSSNEPVLELDG